MSAAQDLPREERLKSIAGLRGSPVLPLSAWRGTSGRRYIVGVHAVTGFDVEDVGPAVVIAVRRNPNGTAEIGSVAALATCTAAEAWLHSLPKTTTELHVHRLAEDAAERAAIAADLNGGAR
ncbi:MAG: hypothetical protein K0Q54_5155 [Methylobacterium brachiatum]|jgi:hypothetical protein|nr:hypothetical protein [Methylobacterium brachiatum]